MGSSELRDLPVLSFGVIADVQYADVEDGYNYTMTSRRYYRTALDMLEKAMDTWMNNKVLKPAFLLQLGDVIDGKCKRFGNIQERCLKSVLEKFSKFTGPIYHVWGNHELYNFSREKLQCGALYSANQIHCKPVRNKVYYSAEPHKHLKIIALDCYEISMLGCEESSAEYRQAEEYLKVNTNSDKNDPGGLYGEDRRFVKYNGAVSNEQLDWLQKSLEEARGKQQNVIVMGVYHKRKGKAPLLVYMIPSLYIFHGEPSPPEWAVFSYWEKNEQYEEKCGHCGVYGPATDLSCLVWNHQAILEILQNYSDCVLTYFAGHDHGGGMATDDTGILHLTFPGVLENNVESDFGTMYMFGDRLELEGSGRVPSLTVKLKFPVENRNSI